MPTRALSMAGIPSQKSSGLLASLFLATAIALGGGGSPSPIPELVLEVMAAAVALVWILGISRTQGLDRVPSSAWIVGIVITAIPLAQLIPLPPFIWHTLPGRKIEYDALSLINEQSNWRTWSLAPARTLSSLLALGPPLLLLTMTSALDEGGRLALIRAVAAMAITTLILGALQHAGGDDSPFQLYGGGTPALTGFQANNNATADFLLIALMTAPLLVRGAVIGRVIPDKPGIVLPISAIFMTICALAVVLASSRMGIALLPIPIFASFWMLRPWINLTSRGLLIALLGCLLAVPILVALAQTNSVLAGVISRFGFSNELRPQLWHDGLYVAQKYFPFGVGMGDFVPAFIADERLVSVNTSMPNRAHNELIELTTETGVFGLMALSATVFLLIREGVRAARSASRQSIALIWFAATSLIILSLHSLVDYPLRSLSLASLAAVCAGLLLTRSSGAGRDHDVLPAGQVAQE